MEGGRTGKRKWKEEEWGNENRRKTNKKGRGRGEERTGGENFKKRKKREKAMRYKGRRGCKEEEKKVLEKIKRENEGRRKGGY